MKCPICDATVDENAHVCPKCGHSFDDESKEIEHLINDILEEDNAENGNGSEEKQAAAQIPETTPKKKTNGKKDDIKEKSIVISRYAIGLFIILSLISLLFPWVVMEGRGVTEGFISDQSTDQYFDEDGSIELSGINIMSLAIKKGEEYQQIQNEDGDMKRSIVSTVHIYYMYAIAVYIILAIVSLMVVLLPLRLKGQSIVRNLAAINLVIAGLNMLAMKFIYFSAFAIRAKQAIAADIGIGADVKYTLEGFAAGNDFYPYTVNIGKGFYFTIIVTAVWFLVAVALTELRNKEELDKIDHEA